MGSLRRAPLRQAPLRQAPLRQAQGPGSCFKPDRFSKPVRFRKLPLRQAPLRQAQGVHFDKLRVRLLK